MQRAQKYDDESEEDASRRVNFEFAAMLMDPSAALAYPFIERDDDVRDSNLSAGVWFIGELAYEEEKLRMKIAEQRRAEAIEAGGGGAGAGAGAACVEAGGSAAGIFLNPFLSRRRKFAYPFVLACS